LSDNFTPTQLGYFLNYAYWESAVELLNFQIQCKQKGNRHFNKLSMFYYEKLAPLVVHVVSSDYFHQRAATSWFYALATEFAVYPYYIPKTTGIGLRNYKFFTYPMRILYYAIGLYVLDLAQEYLREFFQKIISIEAYYGGNLQLDPNTHKLQKLSLDHVYYREHYRKFRAAVKRETENVADVVRIVIHLDIQNYFDEISLPVLLAKLEEYVKPSVRHDLRFDEATKEQIIWLFRFMANGGTGIPQGDNDIVSSFVGFLYLTFADMLIDTVLKTVPAVTRHKIIRYIDDTYIVVDLKANQPDSSQDSFAEYLANRTAELLLKEFGLRLNLKTQLFRMKREEDRALLLHNLKKISFGYEVSDRGLEHEDEESDADGRGATTKQDEAQDAHNEIVEQAEQILDVVQRLAEAQLSSTRRRK
jgi:AbiA family abortive infection protein